MDVQELTRTLNVKAGKKTVFVVADGLGGLPRTPGGKTELETAATLNMDAMVKPNVCGLAIPVIPGR